MQPQTLGSSGERRANPKLDARFPGKYLSVTSFKRDGSGVATPVWFVIENGRLLVKTDAESFKVLILPLYRAVQWLRRAHAETAGVALAITPTPATSNPRGSEDS